MTYTRTSGYRQQAIYKPQKYLGQHIGLKMFEIGY